jgi:hypothetical protein
MHCRRQDVARWKMADSAKSHAHCTSRLLHAAGREFGKADDVARGVDVRDRGEVVFVNFEMLNEPEKLRQDALYVDFAPMVGHLGLYSDTPLVRLLLPNDSYIDASVEKRLAIHVASH